MYVNERDQINYHGFLRALREMNQVSQEAVSIGICTVSGMNRFENGNRIAEKLMRDRLTARLGISGEKYEDYLQPKEYVNWQHRLRIVKAIEQRKLGLAKKELYSYEQLPRLNDLNIQFVEAMRFMMLSIEDASEEILLECINKAVKYTVPDVDKALAGLHLLADQEINLIAEQMRLTKPKAVVRDEKEWRISEYEKLISYMENSHWELLQKAKVYPKVTYYICQLLLETELTESKLRHGLELCHTAIELLRDSSRLYYFIELTEMRRVLAERLLTYDLTDIEKLQLEEMLTENNSWEKVFKDLYAEYDVAPYMWNFCYLYYETECHDMAEVIEIRRNMLGLSRSKLADGICTDRTIVRFERERRNPNIEVVRLLFERLGLCAEYRRARVVTNDVEALFLSNELASCFNDYDCDGMRRCISELRNILVMTIPFNKQEIMRNENILLLRERKIGKDDFIKLTIQELECSLPINALKRKGRKHITRNELSCIFDLAFEVDAQISDICIKEIKKICEIKHMQNWSNIRIIVHELLVPRLASYYGDRGEYKESSVLNKWLLKECLANRRMDVLADNIYGILWNNKMQSINKIVDHTYEIDSLNKCKILSALVKKKNWEAFFQQKIVVLECC